MRSRLPPCTRAEAVPRATPLELHGVGVGDEGGVGDGDEGESWGWRHKKKPGAEGKSACGPSDCSSMALKEAEEVELSIETEAE